MGYERLSSPAAEIQELQIGTGRLDLLTLKPGDVFYDTDGNPVVVGPIGTMASTSNGIYEVRVDAYADDITEKRQF